MRYSSELKQVSGKQKGWKFVDDHTGFYEWSDDAVLDFYGNMTLKRHADEQHPQDRPTPNIQEKQIPWARPDYPIQSLGSWDGNWLTDEY